MFITAGELIAVALGLLLVLCLGGLFAPEPLVRELGPAFDLIASGLQPTTADVGHVTVRRHSRNWPTGRTLEQS